MKKFPNKADWRRVQGGKKNENVTQIEKRGREKKTHKARHVRQCLTLVLLLRLLSWVTGCSPWFCCAVKGSFVNSTPWDTWRVFVFGSQKARKRENGRNRASVIPLTSALCCITWVADRSAITDAGEGGESVVTLTVPITAPHRKPPSSLIATIHKNNRIRTELCVKNPQRPFRIVFFKPVDAVFSHCSKNTAAFRGESAQKLHVHVTFKRG